MTILSIIAHIFKLDSITVQNKNSPFEGIFVEMIELFIDVKFLSEASRLYEMQPLCLQDQKQVHLQ